MQRCHLVASASWELYFCKQSRRNGGRTQWSRKRAGEVLRRLWCSQGEERDTLQSTGRTMCWEMINPPQRPLLRSGGISSVTFSSRELLLLYSQLPPCSFQADAGKPSVIPPARTPRAPAASLAPSQGSLAARPLPYTHFTAVPCCSTSGERLSSAREQTIHAGGRGWESSLRTAVLYPVVFLPGLFQFPALSYLELKRQSAPIYVLCACLGFLICEADFVRLQRNTARAITGWRDRNTVVKGLGVSIQLVSLFSYAACISLCVTEGFRQPSA